MAIEHTERNNNIEQELQRSLSLLRATIDSTPDGILVGDNEGELVVFNRSFEQLWGLPTGWENLPTREQRLGLVLSKLCEPERFLHWFVELSRHPEVPAHNEFFLSDGRIIECSTSPYWLDGHVSGRIWLYRDVTERMHADQELRSSRARLKAIFDNAAVGICVLDANGCYLQVNDYLAELLGYTVGELVGTDSLNVAHEEDIEATKNRFQQIISGEVNGYRLERRFLRKDGSSFWGDLSVTPIYNTNGRLEAIVSIIVDISDRKKAEEQLLESVDRLEHHNRDISLLNDMAEFLQACGSLEEMYRSLGDYVAHFFPQQSGTLYVMQPADMLEIAVAWGEGNPCSPCATELPAGYCVALRKNTPFSSQQPSSETFCPYRDPASLPSLCVPLVAHDEVLGVLSLCYTVEGEQGACLERQEQLAQTVARQLALAMSNLRLRERLQRQAIRDPLTGLFNRRYLDETLEREIQRAARLNHGVGVIVVDLDHFKHFNDTYGHDGGDALLRSVGRLLQDNIRTDDVACRYGGEEFVLVFPMICLKSLIARAQEIRGYIRQLSVEHHGQHLAPVTASFGVALSPDHGNTADSIVKAADAALYEAKRSGRDRVVVASRGGWECK